MCLRKNTRSARVAMAPYPTGTCANCTNHGVLKYARRTMCTRYKCQKAATAERVARLADGGGDDAVVPTYSFEIKEVIGMRFADPERLVGKKRRNGPRRRRRCATSPAASLERTRMTTASLIDTRWAVRQLPQAEPEAALKAYRTAEEKGGLDVRLLTALQVLQVRRTG